MSKNRKQKLAEAIDEIRASMRDPNLMDTMIYLVRTGQIVDSGKRRDGKIVWIASNLKPDSRGGQIAALETRQGRTVA
jgi:hypothetical protein